MAKNFNNKIKVEEPRINGELKIYDEVRLVYKENVNEKSDNDFNRIVSISEAFEMSKKYSLDLVEINSKTTPPIVRLCDYSKYLFELKKSLKQKSKNTVVCKELQLSVNISQHDLEIKVKKAKEFIEHGDKVKVVLSMKGRELTRKEVSKECFNKFIELSNEFASFDSVPKEEGNKVICVLKKK